jgi:hypothetical protein
MPRAPKTRRENDDAWLLKMKAAQVVAADIVAG